MINLLVLNGSNMNLLGSREPEIYGRVTLEEVNRRLQAYVEGQDTRLRFHQSNSEGALIDALQEAVGWADGVVFNPAAYAYTSIALRDTIAGIPIPVVEVHVSNIHARESFRRSILAAVCVGQITGLGWRSHLLGVQALIDLVREASADK